MRKPRKTIPWDDLPPEERECRIIMATLHTARGYVNQTDIEDFNPLLKKWYFESEKDQQTRFARMHPKVRLPELKAWAMPIFRALTMYGFRTTYISPEDEIIA